MMTKMMVVMVVAVIASKLRYTALITQISKNIRRVK